MRKGYGFEYWVKQKLIEKYGIENVIKIPFWEFKGDFIIVEGNKIVRIVECKSTKGKHYYPLQKEREQFKKQIEWASKHNIIWELWLKENGEVRILSGEEVINKYLRGGEKSE